MRLKTQQRRAASCSLEGGSCESTLSKEVPCTSQSQAGQVLQVATSPSHPNKWVEPGGPRPPAGTTAQSWLGEGSLHPSPAPPWLWEHTEGPPASEHPQDTVERSGNAEAELGGPSCSPHTAPALSFWGPTPQQGS